MENNNTKCFNSWTKSFLNKERLLPLETFFQEKFHNSFHVIFGKHCHKFVTDVMHRYVSLNLSVLSFSKHVLERLPNGAKCAFRQDPLHMLPYTFLCMLHTPQRSQLHYSILQFYFLRHSIYVLKNIQTSKHLERFM